MFVNAKRGSTYDGDALKMRVELALHGPRSSRVAVGLAFVRKRESSEIGELHRLENSLGIRETR